MFKSISLIFTIVLSFIFIQSEPLLASEKSKFKKLFKRQKCINCHTMNAYRLGDTSEEDDEDDEGDAVTRDLSTLSTFIMRHPSGPRAFLHKYIKKKIKRNGKKHMFRYKGSDQDLNFLIDHLIKRSKINKR